MSRTLVTGGAGFIGSHLVEALLARGDEVVVLDNLSTGSLENLDGLTVEFIEGDVRDFEVVARAMRGAARVFHQAAFVSVPASMERPEDCYAVNLLGSVHVLQAAREQGVEMVVLASSAAVYGEWDRPVDETMTRDPLSPYAASKAAMEAAARLFSAQFGLPTLCLRYFNVYGPRQSPHSPYAAAIPLFIEAMLADEPPVIFGDGKQVRDFVYVEDVVRANLAAAEAIEQAGAVLNIAAGETVSIRELVAALREILPEAPGAQFGPPRKGDIFYSAADIHRAETALGYRPKTALKDGLQATVQWFLQKGAESRT